MKNDDSGQLSQKWVEPSVVWCDVLFLVLLLHLRLFPVVSSLGLAPAACSSFRPRPLCPCPALALGQNCVQPGQDQFSAASAQPSPSPGLATLCGLGCFHGNAKVWDADRRRRAASDSFRGEGLLQPASRGRSPRSQFPPARLVLPAFTLPTFYGRRL